MPSEQLIEQMQYFVGKVCTIITPPMAMSLTPATHRDWFTISVDGIDHEAVIGTDVLRGTKHLFFFDAPIMGIVEEQTIGPDDPRYKDVKKQMEEEIKKQKKQATQSCDPSYEPSNNFIPIEELQQEAKELKAKWSTSAQEANPQKEKE